MAKKKKDSVENRALYSRISFLQQAATYFATTSAQDSDPGLNSASTPKASLQGLSRRLATDLRAVSLKTRIRLSPALKGVICKFCDSVLLDGESCTTTVENRSNGARKPWADVLVRKCHTCGKEKRYPISAGRPPRKTARVQSELEDTKPSEDMKPVPGVSAVDEVSTHASVPNTS